MLWKTLFLGLLVLVARCQAQDDVPPGDAALDPAAVADTPAPPADPVSDTPLPSDPIGDTAAPTETPVGGGGVAGEATPATPADGAPPPVAPGSPADPDAVASTPAPETDTSANPVLPGAADAASGVTSGDLTGDSSATDTTTTTTTPSSSDPVVDALGDLGGLADPANPAASTSPVPTTEPTTGDDGLGDPADPDAALASPLSTSATTAIGDGPTAPVFPFEVPTAAPLPDAAASSAQPILKTDLSLPTTPIAYGAGYDKVSNYPAITTADPTLTTPDHIYGGAIGSEDQDRIPWYTRLWRWLAWFFYEFGLLVFGMLLLIVILVGMFYACCCMKPKLDSASARSADLEAPLVLPVAKPAINSLNQPGKYVDKAPVTSHTYSYQETKQTTTGAGNFPSTPNNSFAVTPGNNTRVDGIEGVSSLENKNFKGPAPRPTPPASDAGYKYITPRHLDGVPVSHNVTPPTVYDRRLDFPTDANRVSSRDVITAARVASAVTTVAANAPPKTRPENGEQGNSLERERPLLRGASLERSNSPRPFSPTHKTILFIQPDANRDPSDPNRNEEGVLTYGKYVNQGREPSDFAQFSAERRPPPKVRIPDEENVESQV